MLSLDPHNGFVYQVGPLSLSPFSSLVPSPCPTVRLSDRPDLKVVSDPPGS